MGTNCAPLVAYLFCSGMSETSCFLLQMKIIIIEVIEAFSSTLERRRGRVVREARL